MGKQQEKKAPATFDKFFVFGLDDKGKPRGARFAEFNERASNFAVDLKLTGIHPASPAVTEIGMKLPPGRLYSSGKAFIPNIRRDLVDKLQAALAAAGDESKTHKPAAPPEGQSDETAVRTVSPITSADSAPQQSDVDLKNDHREQPVGQIIRLFAHAHGGA